MRRQTGQRRQGMKRRGRSGSLYFGQSSLVQSPGVLKRGDARVIDLRGNVTAIRKVQARNY